MNILLISTNTATTPYPAYPLGMSMVAAALAQAGHAVTQFDFYANGESLEALDKALQNSRPDLIGMSIRNIDSTNLLNDKTYIGDARRIVARLRGATAARIVLGGSGFSIMPEAVLREAGADYGIVGEGEALIVDFARRAERGDWPPPGTCLRAPPGLQGRAIPPALYDRPLLEFYLRSGTIAALQTKRGCCHRCVYCSYPLLEGHRIRPRDPAAVADDIERLAKDHGVKYLFFADSVFNDAEGRYLELIRELRRRNLRVPWTAFFKPAGLDDEALAEMRAAGLKAAEIGADAATDESLAMLDKGFRFADVAACNELFLRHGVATAHYFMFGCPGETPELVRTGIANIKSLRQTANFIFMGLRILPQTRLAEIALREGLIREGQDLLTPVYYLSPRLNKEWLERTLQEGFAGVRHCVFPPDSFDNALRLLHQLGYSGSLWDLLLAEKTGRRRGGKMAESQTKGGG